MVVYFGMFSAHGNVQVKRYRRKQSAIFVGHVEDYPVKDETIVN
jgi:hypothetical protein